MHSPYGLDIVDDCLSCRAREDHLFCNLSEDAVTDLQKIKSTSTYPRGATLFVEGQQPRGAFILCSGKAKLYTSSSEGRTIILRIVHAGEVLGLTSTMSNKPYEATVEILEPSQVNFLPRQDFLSFIARHGEASLHVAQQLSINCAKAYGEIRCLGLSGSAAEKLARMLLAWAEPDIREGQNSARATMSLTHEEVAQMIGASRETVTRLFANFRSRHLIETRGATLVLKDVEGLRKLVSE